MPRLVHRIPSYRKHKATAQAVVTLGGKDYYLGVHGTAASRREYDRIIAQWIARGRVIPAGDGFGSVNELILAYWQWCQGYHRRPDGKPSNELGHVHLSLRPLRRLYGNTPVIEFGPIALKTVRQKWVEAGLCRRTCNVRAGHIKRMFKRGVEKEIVPPSVYHALQCVSGLRKGKSEAHDNPPVRSVPWESVEKVLPDVSPQVGALIRLQWLTGARPGKLFIM